MKKYLQFTLSLIVTLFTLNMSMASEGDTEDFIENLKKQYQNTSSIKVFSLTLRYLGKSDPYQSWDYQAPNRYSAFNFTEVDLEKKHYAQNVVHRFTGGKLYDEYHFQNDTVSLRYEKNGITLGKRVLKQSMNSFERYKNITISNVDFLMVRALLEVTDIKKKVELKRDKVTGKTIVVYKNPDNDILEYTFSDNSLRLLSISNKSKNRIYLYSNYQTTNGLTYARSVVKFYDDLTTPRFLMDIYDFNILKQIDSTRLSLPKGYGPIIPRQDRTLISKQIAANLYLVTDSTAQHNVVFNVNDNKIELFGSFTGSKRIEEMISLIGNQFPEKEISSVYVTHPYSNHIAGLAIYAKKGITIRADSYTIAAIKAYPRFKDQVGLFNFQPIQHGQLLGESHFYILETALSKRHSFVYFEKSGILYQSELLDIAFDNTIPKILPSYTKTFLDFVRKKQLKINRIVSHKNNNNISSKIINRVYHTNFI